MEGEELAKRPSGRRIAFCSGGERQGGPRWECARGAPVSGSKRRAGGRRSRGRRMDHRGTYRPL